MRFRYRETWMAIFLFAGGSPICHAQANDHLQASGDSTAASTQVRHGWSIAPFPVLFSTPETGFGGGAGAILTHRSHRDDPMARPQTIGLVAFYTEQNQALLGLSPDLHLDRDEWRISAQIGYSKFPTVFYGIGHATPDSAREEYTMEGGGIEAIVTRRIYASLRLGATIGVKQPSYPQTEEGGLLDRGLVEGSDGGLFSGIGPYAEWDTRDRAFYPAGGSYCLALARMHGSGIGSDLSYEIYSIDLRRYVSIARQHIVALQVVGTNRTGDVPFDDMSHLGDVLRGIHGGRLLDRTLAVAQAEYRFPLAWRFSGAVFGGAGDVSDGWKKFRIADVKLAGGFGFRFALDRVEKINIRFDFGVSEYGEEGYIELMEAF